MKLFPDNSESQGKAIFQKRQIGTITNDKIPWKKCSPF